jgi:hypothetical protein
MEMNDHHPDHLSSRNSIKNRTRYPGGYSMSWRYILDCSASRIDRNWTRCAVLCVQMELKTSLLTSSQVNIRYKIFHDILKFMAGLRDSDLEARQATLNAIGSLVQYCE